MQIVAQREADEGGGYVFSSYLYMDSGQIINNDWNNIVITYDTSIDSFKIYTNGKEVSSYISPPTVYSKAVANESTDLTLGSGVAVDNILDEVRIYEKGLSQAEIEKHYAEGAQKRGLIVEK